MSTGWNSILDIGSATLRTSSPLIFAAIGGIFSERAGVINIALEGKMLAGAFAAATVAYWTQSPWLGFLAGGLAGMFLAMIYAWFAINLRANQIVTGTAITILAGGAIPFLSQLFFQNTGSTPEVPFESRFALFPIVAAWACALLTYLLFQFSPFGRWHKFAGEHPEALQTSGIDVARMRWAGVLCSGFLAGLGGATLSICLSSNYTRNMVAGRGYMALAALIVGCWKPLRAAIACLIFGLFDVFGIVLQSVNVEASDEVSPLFFGGLYRFVTSAQFMQIVPYILTIGIVSLFVGRSRPPKALGVPFKVHT